MLKMTLLTTLVLALLSAPLYPLYVWTDTDKLDGRTIAMADDCNDPGAAVQLRAAFWDGPRGVHQGAVGGDHHGMLRVSASGLSIM